MTVRDAMTPNPVCCLMTDSARKVAEILCKQNVGSIPVVTDHESRKLIAIITDRDLCCSVMAAGLDPQTTSIEKFVSLNPVACSEGADLDNCEQLMQEHQFRRIPIVAGDARVIGIVSQADLALKDKAGIISLKESKSNITAELGKAQQDLDTASSELAAQQARVDDLEKVLAVVPQRKSEQKAAAPVDPAAAGRPAAAAPEG